jgi:hypothetical protein
MNSENKKGEPQRSPSSENTSPEYQIKTPLQALSGWQAEANRIADAYTRTLAPRHLTAWRMHCGGVRAQLRAYGRQLSDALHALKGGGA